MGSFDVLPHLSSDTPQVCVPDPDLKNIYIYILDRETETKKEEVKDYFVPGTVPGA